MIYGNFEYLGIEEFGDKSQYHSLVVLDGMSTLNYFLNDEMYKKICDCAFKKLDLIQLALEVSPQAVIQNGRNVTLNSTRLSGFARPKAADSPEKK